MGKIMIGMKMITLSETNISPENRPGPKRKLVFQPSIFRCYVSFGEGIVIVDIIVVIVVLITIILFSRYYYHCGQYHKDYFCSYCYVEKR